LCWTHQAEREEGWMMDSKTSTVSLYDILGRAGTLGMVWHCTPLPLRWMSLPYGVSVYTRLLRQCTDLGQLNWMHRNLYRSSLLFRLLRPRYRRVQSYIERRARLSGRRDTAVPAALPQSEPGDRN
jgi:hypothetical protein